MTREELIEGLARVIWNNNDMRAHDYDEVVKLSKLDGYMVAKSCVKRLHIQVKAILDYFPEFILLDEDAEAMEGDVVKVVHPGNIISRVTYEVFLAKEPKNTYTIIQRQGIPVLIKRKEG